MNALVTTSSQQTMSSLQIAELTGKQHKDVMRAIRNMELAWEKITGRKFALSEYKDSTGRNLPCYQLTKTECLYIATKFNDEARAKLVLRWEELEKERMQQPAPDPRTSHIPFLEAQFFIAERLASTLRLNDASRLSLYQSIAEPYNLAVPDYVPSKGVHYSAKELLKRIGSGISSIKFNELLARHGYLETKTRPASGGKTKPFKSITEKGRPYGENVVSPRNQNETQPHWYEATFRELYDIVTGEEEGREGGET